MKLNLCCFSKRVVNVQPNISSQCTAYQSNSLIYSHGLCINLEILILIQKQRYWYWKRRIKPGRQQWFYQEVGTKITWVCIPSQYRKKKKKRIIYIWAPSLEILKCTAASEKQLLSRKHHVEVERTLRLKVANNMNFHSHY